MKKNIIIIGSVILILIFVILIFKENNLIKLNYDEVTRKFDNKESFVLCISKTDCPHCQTYKPKLKSVANKYNIDIYYVDVDSFSKEETKKFSKYISYSGTPNTVFIKEGKEPTVANRLDGDVSSEKIIKKLKSNGYIS